MLHCVARGGSLIRSMYTVFFYFFYSIILLRNPGGGGFFFGSGWDGILCNNWVSVGVGQQLQMFLNLSNLIFFKFLFYFTTACFSSSSVVVVVVVAAASR